MYRNLGRESVLWSLGWVGENIATLKWNKNKIERSHLHILPTIDMIYTLYNYIPGNHSLGVCMNDWSRNDYILATGTSQKTGIPQNRAP